MKILLVAGKCLRELWREPFLLGLMLSLPLFMLALTAAASGGTPLAKSHLLWVYDPQGVGERRLAEIEEESYPDGRPVFLVTQVADRATAVEELKAKPVAALLDFSSQPPALYGDGSNPAFIRTGQALESRLGAAQAERGIAIRAERSPARGAVTEFDAYAPGMMIFGLLLAVPQTALVLGRELRWGTLRRLRLSGLRTGELLSGVCLALLALAGVQALLLWGAALAFGFRAYGSLLLAAGVGLLVSFSGIGAGCVVAGFSRKDSDAINTGSAVTMLQVFLSGAFFAMPSPQLFRVAGYPVGLFDFIPATHAMLALKQILSDGAGWEQVSFRVTATAVLSLVYFGLGVWAFSRFHRQG